MQKFIKKGNPSVTVMAAKVTPETVDAIANWAQAQIVEEKDALSGAAIEALNVKTVSGRSRASNGTYVAQNPLGAFFVVPGAKFESLFKPEGVVPDKVPDQVKNEQLKTMTVVADPFEGMTRFSEGPKP